jgi:hypothetical protein
MSTRTHTARLTTSLALSQPPESLLVAVVYRQDDGSFEGHTYEVAAIQSAVVREYHKNAESDREVPERGMTHDEMIDAGWTPDGLGPRVEQTLLCVGDAFGADSLCTLHELTHGVSNYVGHQIIRWPPNKGYRAITLNQIYREIAQGQETPRFEHQAFRLDEPKNP